MVSAGSEYYIGIDVGGTNMKAGLVSSDGKLVTTLSRPTARTESGILDELCTTVQSLMGHELGGGARGVGVALPGAVDCEQGVAVQATNLPFRDFRVADALSASCGLPVRLENDTDAGVLAELLFGQAKGLSHVVYLAMGTGVGGGLVLNGQLYRGAGCAGEIGHMVVSPTGPMCACGTRGCLEAYASGPALTRLACESGDAAFADAAEVFAAAPSHYAAARAVRLVGEALASVLLSVSRLLAPELIVLGGGVTKAGPPLMAAIDQGLKALSGWGCARIVFTETPDWSGVLGAAAAVANHIA
jgi:glucokinase